MKVEDGVRFQGQVRGQVERPGGQKAAGCLLAANRTSWPLSEAKFVCYANRVNVQLMTVRLTQPTNVKKTPSTLPLSFKTESSSGLKIELIRFEVYGAKTDPDLLLLILKLLFFL